MNIRGIMKKMFNKCRITEENSIDYESAKDILKNEKDAILIDVRSEQEYRENHLDGSINISLYDLERNGSKIELDKQNIIIVYCQSGKRSKRAVEILKQEGYEYVYEIKGGIEGI